MRFRSFTAIVCALALAGMTGSVLVGGTAPAFAQEKKKQDPKKKQDAPAQNQQPQQQQASAISTGWKRICQTSEQTKKEICVVNHVLHAETGQMLAAATVIEEKGAQRIFRIAVPLGMLLEPGLRVVIDQNQPVEAKYAICVPEGCFADLQVNDEFVGNLKKGKVLVIQVINHARRTVNIQFPLAEFQKSYDGPPIDPKEIDKQRQQLQEELNKKAKQMLEQQQKKK